jgi:hypothetical protein
MLDAVARRILASLIVGAGGLLVESSLFAQSIADVADAPVPAILSDVLSRHVKVFRDFPGTNGFARSRTRARSSC